MINNQDKPTKYVHNIRYPSIKVGNHLHSMLNLIISQAKTCGSECLAPILVRPQLKPFSFDRCEVINTQQTQSTYTAK